MYHGKSDLVNLTETLTIPTDWVLTVFSLLARGSPSSCRASPAAQPRGPGVALVSLKALLTILSCRASASSSACQQSMELMELVDVGG